MSSLLKNVQSTLSHCKSESLVQGDEEAEEAEVKHIIGVSNHQPENIGQAPANPEVQQSEQWALDDQGTGESERTTRRLSNQQRGIGSWNKNWWCIKRHNDKQSVFVEVMEPPVLDNVDVHVPFTEKFSWHIGQAMQGLREELEKGISNIVEQWLTEIHSWRIKTAKRSHDHFCDYFCNISEEHTMLGREKYVELMSKDACSVLLNNCNRFTAGNELLTTNSVISLTKDDTSMVYKDLVALAMEKVSKRVVMEVLKLMDTEDNEAVKIVDDLR
ncbi:hypothetical protein BJV74DRAFT_794301 [Russula compacta]|nr:hypothetical protein BJV74DRAFT_794301 [Russula compacta]